ncbi:DUF4259 domain-containing protein [Puniceicoccus vermicola]|uniref:DUF4259 domain-containing protein n=1 Tax=Puniceicoccus vermicola TaxID=388746 RepID=A0A7X1AY90_9BACT|nr:DUF4259 domain-containing protein [Puniceicoccus vermicola]MBC2602102.1 DUF4259 domain-containing protein [Puniceicoccus vermicola]
MGAWGFNTFENDGALDWLDDFLDAPSEKKILEAFSAETTYIQPSLMGRLMGKKPEKFTEELEGDEVLAAGEVVATISGHPANSNPEELKTIPKIHLAPDTTTRALAAIEAILANSNLKDCWEESDDFERWKTTVEDLRERLELLPWSPASRK